jgi:hypothetical protein
LSEDTQQLRPTVAGHRPLATVAGYWSLGIGISPRSLVYLSGHSVFSHSSRQPTDYQADMQNAAVLGVRSPGCYPPLSPGHSPGLIPPLSRGLSPGLSPGLSGGLSRGLYTGLSPGLRGAHSRGLSRGLWGGCWGGCSTGHSPGYWGGLRRRLLPAAVRSGSDISYDEDV